MDKFEDIMVSVAAVFIALLMLLTINTVVYGAETNDTNDGLDSFGGTLSAVTEIKDDKPKWFRRNIYISETQQKFQVVCVYDVRDKYTVIYPVVFAVDGSKLDAKLKVQMKTEDSTRYSTLIDQNLTETFNVPNRWRKSTSGNLWGTYIGIYSNTHCPDKQSNGLDKYKIITSLPLLKYDGSLGPADYGNTVQYAMDKYEEGWEDDPDYIEPEVNENNASKDVSLGYIKNLKCKDLVIKDNNASDVSQSESVQVFSWGSESTTGRKFKDGTYYVQVYLELAAQYSKHVFGIGGGDYEQYISEKKYLKAVPAYDCEIEINYKEETNLFASELEELNKKTFGKGCGFVVNQYFRIIYKDSNGQYFFGNYLKYGTDKPNEDEKGITSEDENGNPTNDSTYNPGSKPDISYGEGETKDEADKNAITGQGKNIDVNLDWFISQLKYLKDSLGEFPQLVSEVFGWLPSSVITLIGVGIAIMIVIALIRAVRG